MSKEIAMYKMTTTTKVKGMRVLHRGTWITPADAAKINFVNCVPCDKSGKVLKVVEHLKSDGVVKEEPVVKFDKRERFKDRMKEDGKDIVEKKVVSQKDTVEHVEEVPKEEVVEVEEEVTLQVEPEVEEEVVEEVVEEEPRKKRGRRKKLDKSEE